MQGNLYANFPRAGRGCQRVRCIDLNPLVTGPPYVWLPRRAFSILRLMKVGYSVVTLKPLTLSGVLGVPPSKLTRSRKTRMPSNPGDKTKTKNEKRLFKESGVERTPQVSSIIVSSLSYHLMKSRGVYIVKSAELTKVSNEGRFDDPVSGVAYYSTNLELQGSLHK